VTPSLFRAVHAPLDGLRDLWLEPGFFYSVLGALGQAPAALRAASPVIAPWISRLVLGACRPCLGGHRPSGCLRRPAWPWCMALGFCSAAAFMSPWGDGHRDVWLPVRRSLEARRTSRVGASGVLAFTLLLLAAAAALLSWRRPPLPAVVAQVLMLVSGLGRMGALLAIGAPVPLICARGRPPLAFHRRHCARHRPELRSLVYCTAGRNCGSRGRAGWGRLVLAGLAGAAAGGCWCTLWLGRRLAATAAEQLGACVE